MIYGVALEGGGAKGAYHAGALRALDEMEIPIQGVTGTSIGAFNGAYYLQEGSKALVKFWESIDPAYLLPESLGHLQRRLKHEKAQNYRGLLKEIRLTIASGGMALDQFKATLNEMIHEDKLRKTQKSFGLVTFSLTDMKPVEKMLVDMARGTLHDFLLATAYLPGFKREKLSGKSYIDGAFYDNLPVNLLIDQGYKKIVAIEVMALGLKKKARAKDVEVITVKPSDDTGHLLNFNKACSQKNIKMGYYDTLRVFKDYYGQWFYVTDIWSPQEAFDWLNQISENKIKLIGGLMGVKLVPYKRSLFEILIPQWMELLKIPPKADYNMILLYVLEFLGKTLSVDRFRVLTMDDLIEDIRRVLFNYAPGEDHLQGVFKKVLKGTKLYSHAYKDDLALVCARLLVEKKTEEEMDYKEKYKAWLNNDYFDQEFRDELKSLEGQDKEIEERFYTDLAFGTGGMRGIIGAGTNRINAYVIRKASQGFANFAKQRYAENSIVIAYDCRRMSPEFALETALVFAGNGIKAYLFESLRSTPELSYAVRQLKASVGVVVTASHNPPAYNGFKVYGDDGCQLLPDDADLVVEEVKKIKDFKQVKRISEAQALEQGLLTYIEPSQDDLYLDMVESVAICPGLIKETPDLKVVYTPLHGTGGRPIKEIMTRVGLKHFLAVEEQMVADENFTSLKSPNPEDITAFEMGIAKAKACQADVVIATDPDCDRVGVVVKSGESYVALNGNQLGVLLVDYILNNIKEMPDEALVVNTIVTSGMAQKVIESHGALLESTLTGFKFIGEKIKENETTNKTFLFGYEESYGYLAGSHVRDKDAVIATMLVVEMVALYKKEKQTLIDRLDELYKTFGYYQESLTSIVLEGKAGLEKIKATMADLRQNPFTSVANQRVVKIMDCMTQEIIEDGQSSPNGLPPSDVLKFYLEDGSWFAARPSGTEPKLKVYFSISGETMEDCQGQLATVEAEVLSRIRA